MYGFHDSAVSSAVRLRVCSRAASAAASNAATVHGSSSAYTPDTLMTTDFVFKLRHGTFTLIRDTDPAAYHTGMLNAMNAQLQESTQAIMNAAKAYKQVFQTINRSVQ